MTDQERVEEAARGYSTYRPDEPYVGLNIRANDQYVGFKAGVAWRDANPVVSGDAEALAENYAREFWKDPEREVIRTPDLEHAFLAGRASLECRVGELVEAAIEALDWGNFEDNPLAESNLADAIIKFKSGGGG